MRSTPTGAVSRYRRRGGWPSTPPVTSREADHQHLDEVLQARVSAEDAELGAVSKVTLLDRLLRPANRAGTKRFLAEARAKVWLNTITLDRARRAGESEYRARLADLEQLCAARLVDLARPGLVLLSLARRGFGVVLPPS